MQAGGTETPVTLNPCPQILRAIRATEDCCAEFPSTQPMHAVTALGVRVAEAITVAAGKPQRAADAAKYPGNVSVPRRFFARPQGKAPSVQASLQGPRSAMG
jgi:hypothetical protein